MTDPRFPIGKFHYDGPPTESQRAQLIANIEQPPAALREAVKGQPRSNSTLPTATAGGPSAKSPTTFPTAT